jgi:hypothetical protein
MLRVPAASRIGVGDGSETLEVLDVERVDANSQQKPRMGA